MEPCLNQPFQIFSDATINQLENKIDFDSIPVDKSLLTPLALKLALSLTILSLLLTVFKKSEYDKGKNVWEKIPGPKGVWLLGHAHYLWSAKDRFKNWMKWSLDYQPYYMLKIGTKKVLMLSSPSSVQKILSSSEEGHMSKASFYDVLRPIWNDGVVLSKHKKWKDRRRLLARAFSLKSLMGYMDIYNKQSKHLVEELTIMFENGEENELGKPIDKLLWRSALKVVCETVMGTDVWDTENIDKIMGYGTNVKKLCMMRAIKPWFMIDFIWNLHPSSKDLKKWAKMLTDFVQEVIELRMKSTKFNSKVLIEEVIKEDNTLGLKRPFTSMVDEMVMAGLDMEALVEEATTLITTGYETSSTTIQYAMFLLALNPIHQKACQEEIDSVFNDNELCPNGDLTYAGLGSLKYLERCVQETLRIYPVTFIIFRELEKPLDLDDNVQVPAGGTVGIFIPGVHKNPDIYPNPDKFDPDRFLPENSADRSHYAFIPFSAGDRNCLGFKFGMMEIKMMLARILHNFNIKTTDKKDDIKILPELVLTPERGYNFILEKRKHNDI